MYKKCVIMIYVSCYTVFIKRFIYTAYAMYGIHLELSLLFGWSSFVSGRSSIAWPRRPAVAQLPWQLLVAHTQLEARRRSKTRSAFMMSSPASNLRKQKRSPLPHNRRWDVADDNSPRTAGLHGLVLLLLFQHWSNQHMCTVLGLYNSSPLKTIGAKLKTNA